MSARSPGANAILPQDRDRVRKAALSSRARPRRNLTDMKNVLTSTRRILGGTCECSSRFQTGRLLVTAALIAGIVTACQGKSKTTSEQTSGRPAAVAYYVVDQSTADAKVAIWTMSADGSNGRRLTDPDDASAYEAHWSPTGREIAYTRISGADNADVYLMSPDGSRQRPLVADPIAAETSPDWSPDGTKIAFTRDAGGGGPQIVVLNIASGKTTQLTTEGNNVTPAWSRDGRRIAFDSTRASKRTGNRAGGILLPGDDDIYVMNADGSGQRRITRTPENAFPAWSPDGRSIAFVSNRDGQAEVYVANADGLHARRLTHSSPTQDVTSVSWLPDGRIAFSRGEIYLIKRDGTGLRRIASDGADKYDPRWRPRP
jgi:Tol biopolymer transport system component